MSETYNYCHVAELTDKGCKRPSNEDWLMHFESPNGLVAVVCDGMGGHVGGQVASHTAIDAIHQYMMRERGGSPAEQIVEAMNAANAAILNRALQQPELTGMGSTCVMLVVRDGKVYIGSVGDSRAYLIRNHRIKQLTVDQSYVQMLVDAGSITPEEAEHHHRKNEITNALGLKGMQPATVLPKAIQPEAGDCFLLCSDGLSGMVPDKEIEKVVSRQSDKTQQERVEELVTRAKRHGGVDNITCQIVEFSVSPNAPANDAWWKKHGKILACVAIAAILAVLIGIGLARKSGQGGEHSDAVKKLMGTVDSVKEFRCGIPYVANKDFLELTENKDFVDVKATLRGVAGKDTTIIIRHPLSIRHLEVAPSDGIRTTFLDRDSTRCVLSFTNKMPQDETEISVTLRGKPSYLLLIPLQASEGRIVKSNARSRDANKRRTLIEKDYGEEDAPKDAPGEIEPGQPQSSDVDCTIKVNKSNYVILINGQDSDNADSRLYYPAYGFTECYLNEEDMGWYKIKNDGRTCIITIKKIPVSKSKIELPTNPECNGGEGIILRIQKQTH